MKDLCDFKDQISDEFQSTFTVVAKNIMVNFMHKKDHAEVEKIIYKYLPLAKVGFRRSRLSISGDDYTLWEVVVK